MRNISQSRQKIKSHQVHPAAAAVRDKLNAGAFTRCPSCLNWIDRKQTGVMAVFAPNDGSAPIGYALCRRCARYTNGDSVEQKALVERCETYLMGGAK